jgi:hypothetical protein
VERRLVAFQVDALGPLAQPFQVVAVGVGFVLRGVAGAITLTQASRAPGRMPSERRTAWRSEYSVASLASRCGTATITIGTSRSRASAAGWAGTACRPP